MVFKKLEPVFGNEIWGARSGRHSYIISFTEGHGYTASWNDASAERSNVQHLISWDNAVATFDEAVKACKKHRKQHLLK